MADPLAAADRAFVEEEYDQAVQLYTEALAASSSARTYESRAHCHIKLENYVEAAEDAGKAIELEPGNAKAYLRKGVACFHLEEYEAAKEAFEAGQALAPENSQFKTWIRKCQAEIDDEKQAAGKATAAAPAASPTPAAPAAPAAAAAPAAQAAPAASAAPASAAAASTTGATAADQPLAPAAAAAPTHQGKYRHQWYQLQNVVSVDVYAKNLKPEQVTCEFEQQRLRFSTRDEAGVEDFSLDVELYGKVVPEKCKFSVLRPKVEISMVKADNIQWGSLEKSNKVAAPNYSTPGTTAPTKFPTSAKNPRDWDKVTSELSELEKKGELDDGDPLSNFFKKIFGQGDEDQRRAMMKSFVESNGTVLSTNWEDVGKKKVECTPPEGMEVKKYEL